MKTNIMKSFIESKGLMDEYILYTHKMRYGVQKNYAIRNKEKLSEYHKKYYEENKEKMSLYSREYFRKNYVPKVKNSKFVQRNNEIKELRSQGITFQAIADKFCMSQQNVRNICMKNK